jgi:hypothetical protein
VYELRLLMGANECPADCLRTVHRALVRNGRIDPARRRRRRSDYKRNMPPYWNIYKLTCAIDIAELA